MTVFANQVSLRLQHEMYTSIQSFLHLSIPSMPLAPRPETVSISYSRSWLMVVEVEDFYLALAE